MNDGRRFAPATTRNREPILALLRRFVRAGANVLEIASGSGEHAMFLAPRLDVATWQPTDRDPAARESIDAWRTQGGAEAVRPAMDLDVTVQPWPALDARPDVIMCANMIHIAPWRACEGLLAGAAAVLDPDGLLYLYGPFKREGVHTAPSNAAFDESLRARDSSWGVRDLEEVTRIAASEGLLLDEVATMPANNLSVILRRSAR